MPKQLPAAARKEIEQAPPNSAHNLAVALGPAVKVLIQAPALAKYVAPAQATFAQVIQALEARAKAGKE